ncbi:bacteriorhodopsin [Haladaptatus sp. NG-WS-4]
MSQPGQEAIWLWIGTIGMALGTIYFIARGWGVREKEQQAFFIVTGFITTTAFASYLAMATGFGLTEVTVDGRTLDIYWARYADWLITTPLLLLDLALLARADRNTTGTLIGIDVFMIATGLIAALTTVASFRLLWWGVSSGALLVLLYFLVGTLTSQAATQDESVSSLFWRLRNLTIGLWVLYPIVWVVGTESTLSLLPLYWETAAFMVLDLGAKVGFGFILLRSRSVLAAAREPTELPERAPA